MTLTMETQVYFRKGRSGRLRIHEGTAPPEPEVESGNVPRVSRLMALAIRFERLVGEGVVQDYADLARMGHVTRARVTQIMNLLCLAPDIQEALLFLPRTVEGRDPVTERHLRPISAEPDWKKQRLFWQRLLSTDPKA